MIALTTLVIGCLLQAAAGETTAGFHITKPASLVSALGNNGNVNHNEALFGINTYGSKLTGTFVYVGSMATNDLGCDPYTNDEINSWPPAAILLVDRGNCTFRQKVQYAQAANADAVIILDDVYHCGEHGCPACGSQCFNTATCSCALPFLADDNKGVGEITIPSYIISRGNGETIKSCMLGVTCTGPETTVIASLSWDLPNPDGRVEWELWSSSWDLNAIRFKREFETINNALGSSVQFTPHYFIYDGTEWGCDTPLTLCTNQCTNGGLYCESDPNEDLSTGLSGAEVVEENARQICIWQVLSASQNTPKWWRYVNLFQDQCAKGDNPPFNLDCSQKIQNQLGIDSAAVTNCINSNGGIDGSPTSAKIPNQLMANEIQGRADLAILVLPTVIINGIILRGGTSSGAIFQDICNGFLGDTEPSVCGCAGLSIDGVNSCINNINNGGNGYPSGSVVLTPLALFFLIFSIIAIFVGGAFFTVRYIRKQTDLQVHKTLSHYRPLDDFGDENGKVGRV